MKISTVTLPELFHRWRKAEWPRAHGPHDPLRGEEMRNEGHIAGEDWEDEGGAVQPAAVPGPKLPL